MPNFPDEQSENILDARNQDMAESGGRFGFSPSTANYTTIRNGQLARSATPSEDKSDTTYDTGPPSKTAEVRRSPKTRRGTTSTPAARKSRYGE
jgi:hypothetical protein